MPIHFYGELLFLPQHKAYFAFTNRIVLTVEETRRSSLSSTELSSKRRQQLERTIQKRSAFGVDKFSTPQARFREGYRKIPYESRRLRQENCPTQRLFKRCSTMSKNSDDENDDFSLLTNLFLCRTLNLTILNAFPGNCVLNCVEIESLRRI